MPWCDLEWLLFLGMDEIQLVLQGLLPLLLLLLLLLLNAVIGQFLELLGPLLSSRLAAILLLTVASYVVFFCGGNGHFAFQCRETNKGF